MNALAEDSMEDRAGAAFWLRRIALAVVVLLLIAALAWWLRSLGGASNAPKKQVAKISLLPNTPPPPPPPPKEEPKLRPQEQPKPQQAQQKAPEAPPAPAERLSMEGRAGDGPSAFGAGPVTSEYKGGEVGQAASKPAGGTPSQVDRAQERFFANSARQLLRDEIERHLKSDAPQVTAVFAVWFEADGRIRKFDLEPTGDARSDTALNAALDETSRSLKLAPPAGLTQPLRFRLTLRPIG